MAVVNSEVAGTDVALIGGQIDLFVESLVSAPLRDDRATMEFPFFALQKRPLLTPIFYQDGNVSIRISPGERGIASIWDKDVLIYLSSLINAKIERGEEVSRTVRIAAYDLLRVTRRHTGKNGYQEIYDALFRLRSTTITTDIQSGGERETRGFGWIDSFRILTKENKVGSRVMQGLEITLNDWTFRALVKDRRVLSINPAYFDLTGGLERRLYEIARKHVGRQTEWRVSLLQLAKKCGTMQRNLRRFKFDLKELAELDRLPDYQMFLVNDHSSPTAKALQSIGMKSVKGAKRTPNEAVIVLFKPRGAPIPDIIVEVA
ncbi:replication initiator protein A [Acidisphaera sp. S103]|jgi:plasmid replication initiation protein|uniref:replication initiator protein A n=1 Tax=Acidisphaera sp. S103 TaxID=1747223 RepID=UPI00131C8FFF|nr:replication initiator protein A [Acidisphaera sp. S103]